MQLSNKKLKEGIETANPSLQAGLLRSFKNVREGTVKIGPYKIEKCSLYGEYWMVDAHVASHPLLMSRLANPAGVEFLHIEVETASTFARIASEAQDPEKRLRNVQNARRGYDTLLHFMQTLTLSNDDRAEMHQKVSQLRVQLLNLGENV